MINKLESLGINPSEWVSELFTFTDKKRRERNRKTSTPIDVEVNHEDDDLGDQETFADTENGNSGNNDMNDTVMTETFDLEEEMNNDLNLFRTSTTMSGEEGLTRRVSARQAVKRARLERMPSVPEGTEFEGIQLPHSPLSPISSGNDSLQDPSVFSPQPGPSAAPPPPTPAQPSTTQFKTRRNPIGSSSNFRSPLHVNVGEDLAMDGSIVEMHIPSDLVETFELLAQETTELGVETGGILAGVHKHIEDHFEVTHLIIPEQTDR